MVSKSDVGGLLSNIAMADPVKAGLSTEECYVLDFIRTVGTLAFASSPFDDFLNVIMRQIGESQPAVKHGAMALTVASRTCDWCYFGHGFEKMTNMGDFVLRQTSKSLTHLLEQPTPDEGLSSRRAHREAVMTMCGILALLANVQDDYATAKLHLMFGRRAMREWQDTDFDRSSIGPTLSAILAHVEYKMEIGFNPTWFLQDDSPLLLRASDLIRFNVATAESAVSPYWNGWSSLVLHELPNGSFRSNADCPEYIVESGKISFLFRLRIYVRQLKTYIEQVGLSAPQSTLDLLSALRLWEQVACAMVAAALAADEDGDAISAKPLQMRYDALLAYFGRINEMSKAILQRRSNVSCIPPSTSVPMEPTVGTPLFFCGYCCRDWSTRREALHLLKTFEARFKGSTGFLPAKISALERIIDIESHGLQPGDAVPGSARISFFQFTVNQPGSPNILRFSYRQLGSLDRVIDLP